MNRKYYIVGFVLCTGASLNSSVVELSLGGVTFGVRAVNLSEVNLKIIE